CAGEVVRRHRRLGAAAVRVLDDDENAIRCGRHPPDVADAAPPGEVKRLVAGRVVAAEFDGDAGGACGRRSGKKLGTVLRRAVKEDVRYGRFTLPPLPVECEHRPLDAKGKSDGRTLHAEAADERVVAPPAAKGEPELRRVSFEQHAGVV